ncbi:DNA-binding transcriptional regulator, LacI/PurR family [Gemmobacter megaterium]|uniref:DNA-binding transcriptional regulator, LacI/PurR family n=1 Tax=Gemmobacter megaterium TaxID=1086013 RepID=A0A1N7Q834_9RHOB|nr:hypothetical protein GCM10011345_32380 [Gemmobacter megaterium]SIT19020.1 DNA-binding transcriptional regulator, LacI/PurR family [Gemmobacter megaterium]
MTSHDKTRKVTMKDVARQARVALGTVSRIVNGNATVTPELRKHVETVIDQLGYRPNPTARTLRTNRTNAIGIIVTDLRQPIAARLAAAASEVVRGRGFAPIVGDFLGDTRSEETLLRFMAERGVDGLLLTISSDEDPVLLEMIEGLDIPIVLWERDAAGRFPSVRSDHRLGARLAAASLIGLRRRVLLVAGHEQTWVGREQVAGVQEGLADQAALAVEHTGRFSPDRLAVALVGPDRPDAVIANIHDIPAIMVTIARSGLSCPADISVISIGDDPFLEIASPAISAIRLRPDLVGVMAAQALIARLDHKKARPAPTSELVIYGAAECAGDQMGAACPPAAPRYGPGGCAAHRQRPLPEARRWTQSRLLRAVKAYFRDGLLPETVLCRAGPRETDDRLPAIVAAIKGVDTDIARQAIFDRLEAMRERTPRGRTRWQTSSVKMLLERAERLGLLSIPR